MVSGAVEAVVVTAAVVVDAAVVAVDAAVVAVEACEELPHPAVATNAVNSNAGAFPISRR